MKVYGFCIRTLRLPVISVMIIGVMRLSYSERAVPDGRFRRHLFQAVFMRTTYPSRCVYLGGQVSTQLSRALLLLPLVCENPVKTGSGFKPLRPYIIAHERRVLSRPDLHQIKDLFLCFLKILT